MPRTSLSSISFGYKTPHKEFQNLIAEKSEKEVELM